jgi:hypothetical protein
VQTWLNVELNALKNIVVKHPLCGHDELSNVEKAFCSRPVDELFAAYLDHSHGHGAVLCVHDAFGNGKSATASIVARGRHPQGPNRFLVVTPVSSETGSAWLNGIKVKLDILESTSFGNLVQLLKSALLEDDTPTGDQFRVDVTGDRRHENKETQGKPLLILEDLNPSFFSDQNTGSVFDTVGRIGREEMLEAETVFGVDALNFLKDLARTCYAHGFVVLVTTMYPRVAKYLHKAVNGGEKFQISESLMCKQYGGADFIYSAEIFHFESHFVGLWNDASKVEMLLQKFPDCAAEDVHGLMHKLPNASIRNFCHQLTKMRAKKSSGKPPSNQQSDSPDSEKKGAFCCSSLVPDSFTGNSN